MITHELRDYLTTYICPPEPITCYTVQEIDKANALHCQSLKK